MTLAIERGSGLGLILWGPAPEPFGASYLGTVASTDDGKAGALFVIGAHYFQGLNGVCRELPGPGVREALEASESVEAIMGRRGGLAGTGAAKRRPHEHYLAMAMRAAALKRQQRLGGRRTGVVAGHRGRKRR